MHNYTNSRIKMHKNYFFSHFILPVWMNKVCVEQSSIRSQVKAEDSYLFF